MLLAELLPDVFAFAGKTNRDRLIRTITTKFKMNDEKWFDVRLDLIVILASEFTRILALSNTNKAAPWGRMACFCAVSKQVLESIPNYESERNSKSGNEDKTRVVLQTSRVLFYNPNLHFP